MKFVFNDNKKWSSVQNVEDWISSFKDSKKNEEGKSALSLAQFCKRPDIESIIKGWIEPIINENYTLLSAMPEESSSFDDYGKGRIHDLGIKGKTESGKTIFIGVEAKVNETYNGYVSTIYSQKKVEQQKGKSTYIPERIEGLISRYFSGKITVDSNVRYQLLYAFAGTVCEDCDYTILAFVTFKKECKESSLRRNKQDLINFLEKIGYNRLSEDLYKCEISGRTLYIIEKVV